MNPLFREMFLMEEIYKLSLKTGNAEVQEENRKALLKAYYDVIRDYSGMNIYLNVEAAAA